MNSIRGRLSIWLASSTLLVAVASGIVVYRYVHSAMLQQFDAGLSVRVRALASLLRVDDEGKLALDFSHESMPEFLHGSDPEYFQAFFPDGSTFQGSASLRGARLTEPALVNPESGAWDLALPDGRPGRAVAVLGSPHSEAEDLDERPTDIEREQNRVAAMNAPRILFVVAHDRTDLNQLSSILLWTLVVTTTGMAAACLILVRLIVARELKPLNKLAAEATSISADTLGCRFGMAGNSQELRPIYLGLNGLLQRLEEAFKRERRINADIAHELRTPISELRSLTEVAKLPPFETAQLRRYLADAYDVAIRMEALVETLLALARNQAGSAQAHGDRVVLRDLVSSLFERSESEVFRRRLGVEIDIPDGQAILTDSLMFVRIVDNLITNAVQYAALRGRIVVRTDRGSEGALILRISNSNDSLNVADLDCIFQPFWRKDTSRTDSRRSGLGLALVREYAKVLGMAVIARIPEAGQFEISLELPAPLETKEAISADAPHEAANA